MPSLLEGLVFTHLILTSVVQGSSTTDDNMWDALRLCSDMTLTTERDKKL